MDAIQLETTHFPVSNHILGDLERNGCFITGLGQMHFVPIVRDLARLRWLFRAASDCRHDSGGFEHIGVVIVRVAVSNSDIPAKQNLV